jgi:hypothetical protein
VDLLAIEPGKETPRAHLAAVELFFREVFTRLGCLPYRG